MAQHNKYLLCQEGRISSNGPEEQEEGKEVCASTATGQIHHSE